MFAVYNNGSVGFRSTADNLYELKKLENIASLFEFCCWWELNS